MIPRVWAAQSRRLRGDGGRVLGPGEDGRKRAESVGDRVLFQVLKGSKADCGDGVQLCDCREATGSHTQWTVWCMLCHREGA